MRFKPHIPPELLRAQDHRSSDIIRAIALSCVFDGRDVLRGVDVAIRRGEVFVIMGPSGCGKTTLLRLLCGLQPPTTGSVFVNGQDIYTLGGDRLDEVRLQTGLSFQGGALLGAMSVVEIVARPMRENTDLSEAVIQETARMKLDMGGLLHAADLLPASLSGGMKKRAAIARAMALDPEVLYFDEPSAGLDPVTAAEVDNLILKINKVFGVTVVVVTHDLPSAYTIADRIIMLHSGDVLAVGTRDQVWNHPDARLRQFIERRMDDQDSQLADVAAVLTGPGGPGGE
mgnify:CR=1 FL=1